MNPRELEGTLAQLAAAHQALSLHHIEILVVRAEQPPVAEHHHATTRLEALELLTRSALPALRSLTVKDGWFTEREARVLAGATWAGQLEQLILEGHPLGDQGVAALLAGGAFISLRTLRLRGCELATDEAVRALAEKPGFAALVELDLSGNALGPTAAAVLAGSTVLGSLRRLDLSRNQLTWAELEQIFRARPGIQLVSRVADEGPVP